MIASLSRLLCIFEFFDLAFCDESAKTPQPPPPRSLRLFFTGDGVIGVSQSNKASHNNCVLRSDIEVGTRGFPRGVVDIGDGRCRFEGVGRGETANDVDVNLLESFGFAFAFAFAAAPADPEGATLIGGDC